MTKKIALAALLASVSLYGVAMADGVDPRYQSYKPVSGVSGTMKSVGSDTLNNVMTLWAEDFKKLYPGVQIEVEGKGSSTAPPALIAGTSQFGPMSRAMRGAEIDGFTAKYGYAPTQARVAVDALAVFVNKDNPIKCLTIAQLDGIFSVTHASGGADVKTWDQVGLKGDFAGKPISMFGRNSASGTYSYFKEVALLNGDYKSTVKEQPGSSAVIQGIAADKYAIGYSGIGYKTADVRAVEVAGRDGQCQDPSQQKAYTGKYPITRFLYIYVNKNPSKPFEPLRGEFLKFVFSKGGQEALTKDGFYAMPYTLATDERNKLGLGN